MHKQRLGIIAAGAVGMLATFLPWIQAPIIGSVLGSAHAGWFTFGFFLVSSILGLLGDHDKSLGGKTFWGSVVLAGCATCFGIWKIIDVNGLKGPSDDPFAAAVANAIQVGIGLYLVVISGVAVVTLAFVLRRGASEMAVESREQKQNTGS